MPESSSSHNHRKGFLYAAGAFLAWGFFPIYFKAIKSVSPLEIVVHRVLWSAVLLIGILAVRGRLREIITTMQTRRTFLPLCMSTLFIATNWLDRKSVV